MSGETEIRSFRVDMPDEAITDLRRRIADTRRPVRELVVDRSQGVQLATLAELARYWMTEYDWRASLLASPVGLVAWMLGHDTDSYYKIPRAFLDVEPSGGLTRDPVRDNITLYWLTGTRPRPPGRTGRTRKPRFVRPDSLARRSSCRSGSSCSPARSGGPRAAGSRSPTQRHLPQRG
jgi:hypothetical protein